MAEAEAHVYGIMMTLLDITMFKSYHALSKLFWADLPNVAEATDETRSRVRRVHTVGNVECNAWHKSSVQPSLRRGAREERMGAPQHHAVRRASRDSSGIAAHVCAYRNSFGTSLLFCRQFSWNWG